MNKLGPEGAKALGPAIAVSGSLKRLLIGDNDLGDKGCIALAEAMQQNDSCKIEELDLQYNKIGVAGAKSLAAMIAVRNSLTQVQSNLMPHLIPLLAQAHGSPWP